MDTALLPESLNPTHLEDLKLAASGLSGYRRRAFQAQMSQKYCGGNARQTEYLFGWGRNTVTLGLHEQRTGLICFGAQSASSGNHRWEDKNPDIAAALWKIAETHSQQDPTFRTSLAFTRLTASEALHQLCLQGFPAERLPCASSMANILNRNDYRLRPVLKAKPQKNSTDR